MPTAEQLSSRSIVFNAFWPFLSKQKTGRKLLDESLSNTYERLDLSTENRKFITHLSYTLCRYWFALDPIIDTLSQFPRQKMENKVLLLLKIGLIQLTDLVEVPQHAAIFETIELAKTLKLSTKSQGFIHAILQNYVRKSQKDPQTFALNPTLIFPAWYRDRLTLAYSETWFTEYTQAFLIPPQGLSIRHNPLKITLDAFKLELKKAEITFETPDPSLPEALYIPDLSRPQAVPGYTEGWFTPQDLSATRASAQLNPQKNERILEIGAAPGGKTTHLSALMQNTGQIIAIDSSSTRLQQLKDNTTRLGCTNIQALTLDMCSIEQILACEALKEPFDRILIDAPCSATGIIRKHPDILLQLKPEDAASRQKTQIQLILNAMPLLKKGGTLLYATCSIDPEENQHVVQAVLKQTPLELISETLSPLSTQQDGFYVGVLRSPH